LTNRKLIIAITESIENSTMIKLFFADNIFSMGAPKLKKQTRPVGNSINEK